jgi:hypothetical protein
MEQVPNDQQPGPTPAEQPQVPVGVELYHAGRWARVAKRAVLIAGAVAVYKIHKDHQTNEKK